MKAKEFNAILENSALLVSDVLKLIFDKGFAKREDFPNAFNEKNKVLLEFKDSELYNTFCPFHDGQNHGDSFAIYNHRKNVICYNGECLFSSRPMSLIELVMALVLKKDASIVFEFELSKKYYWESVHFLVEHFGDELGLKLQDVKKRKQVKKNPVEEVLSEAASYYNFLGTKSEFHHSQLREFLMETRHLKYSDTPVEDLIEKYRLGITPNSSNRNMLYKYLLKQGHHKKDILESGICRERDGKITDFFHNRAIVPYTNNGKVIGFYGRDLNPNGNKRFAHLRLEGKIRTPNGIDRIINEEEFFLVEGEFSKIAVNALGYENVMETRGVNGFRQEHAEIIKLVRKNNPNKCKKCYIMFDPDSAGKNSVEKIGRTLIGLGVEVLVIRLPVIQRNGENIYIDPNDLFKIYKKDAKNVFKRLLQESISYDSFMLLNELEKNKPSNFSEARMLFQRLSPYLSNTPSIERIFIVEEVLAELDTLLDKDILREYFKLTWISGSEKKPVVGLEEAIYSEQNYYLLTKSEGFFKKHKKAMPFLVLIREPKAFFSKVINKNILLDATFDERETQKFTSFQDCKVKRVNVQITNNKIKFNAI